MWITSLLELVGYGIVMASLIVLVFATVYPFTGYLEERMK